MTQKKNKVNEIIHGKIPPQAIDLEETILGTLLSFNGFQSCYKTINSKMFYKETHRIIYEAMESLFKTKSPITILSVSEQLRSTDQLDMIGGPYFLTQLEARSDPTRHHIDFYARIINQKYMAREVIRITSEGQEKAFDQSIDVYDIIEYLYSEIQATSHVNYIDYSKITHYERIILKICISEEGSFMNLKGNIPDYFFVDAIHQVIWNILIMLYDTNVPTNRNSVRDILQESDNKKYIPYFEQFYDYDYESEMDTFSYLVTYLKKNYDRTQIFKLYQYLEKARLHTEPEAIIKKIEDVLDNIRVKDLDIKSFKSYLDSTYIDIIAKHKDGNYSVIKTGYPYVDSFCKFSARNIVMLGGSRGHGKTRMVIKLVHGILTNNSNIAAFFITMEDPAEKVIRLLMSAETGLDEDKILSIDHKLSVEERDKIKKAYKDINHFDIDFIDRPVSMAHAEAAYVKFAKKRPEKQVVLVLDNLMLLEDMDSTVKTEDRIAKRLPAIVEKTNGLLFVLHHFTKAQKERANLETGYRPEEEHLKGSTRFLDVSHYVLLMNLLVKYPDFMLLQERKPKIKIGGKKINRTDILKKLLIIEVSKHRDGSNDEDARVLRFYPIDLGTMQIKEWR